MAYMGSAAYRLDQAESRLADITKEYDDLQAQVDDLQTQIDDATAGVLDAQDAAQKGREKLGLQVIVFLRDIGET